MSTLLQKHMHAARAVASIIQRDVRRLVRNPVALVVVLGVIVIPSLYAWFNIAANWDPYASTQDMVVAVVNEDQGAQVGTLGTINAGNLIEEQLAQNTQLKWTFMAQDEARQAVQSGQAYGAILIPQDFTANLAQVLNGNPTHPAFTYLVNEKINAVAPKVTDTGASTLATTVNETFVQTATRVIVDRVQSVVRDAQAGDTAMRSTIQQQLQQEATKLRQSADALEQGAQKLEDAKALSQDSLTLLSGIDQFNQELHLTLDAQAPELLTLKSTLQELGTSSTRRLVDVQTSLMRLNNDVQPVISDAHQAWETTHATVNSGLEQAQNLLDTNKQTLQTLKKLSSVLPSNLKVQLESLADLLDRRINDHQATLDRLSTLKSDAEQQAQALSQLSAAQQHAQLTGTQSIIAAQSTIQRNILPSMLDAIDQLSQAQAHLQSSIDGTNVITTQAQTTLNQLSSALENTQGSLNLSAEYMRDLANQLENQATDMGALQSSMVQQKLNEFLVLDSSAVATTAAQPLILNEDVVFPVDHYGTGVAPFYTNLALWVGGFVLIAIFKLEVDVEGLSLNGTVFTPTPTQAYLARSLMLSVLGMLQGLVCTIGDLMLGIQALNPLAFIATGIILSFVYTHIIVALSSAFKHIGKALCVLLVILQIPGSAGMYPIEMMPDFFQALHPWLPFTYGINAMRETLAGFWGNAYVLNLVCVLLFLIPAGLVGMGLRRSLLNINALFDKRLRSTHLLTAEEHALTTEHFKTAQILQVLVHAPVYAPELTKRAQTFEKRYPRLVARGFAALYVLPLLLTIVMFALPYKFTGFVIWIVSLIAIMFFLIVVEYMHDAYLRAHKLVHLKKDEVEALLAHHAEGGDEL